MIVSDVINSKLNLVEEDITQSQIVVTSSTCTFTENHFAGNKIIFQSNEK